MTFAQMSTIAWSRIAKICKQCKFPPTGKLIDKMWQQPYKQEKGINSTRKGNKLLIHTIIWQTLKPLHKVKETRHKRRHTIELNFHEMSRKRNFRKMDKQIISCMGLLTGSGLNINMYKRDLGVYRNVLNSGDC